MKEQITDLKGVLVILGQLFGSGKGELQILVFLLFLRVELRDMLFGP